MDPLIEHDPDPTEPTKTCPVPGCPCRSLDQAADAWRAAADLVGLADDGVVVDFVPRPKRKGSP
jgi:hypothetical protein